MCVWQLKTKHSLLNWMMEAQEGVQAVVEMEVEVEVMAGAFYFGSIANAHRFLERQ
jgi:hypothetical protein